MEESLKKSTIGAASWNLATMLANHLKTFVVSLILARILNPEDFGLLGMATVFASITESFVDFGFGNAVIQKKDVNRLQLSTVFWVNNIFAVILCILMYSSSSVVAAYFEMPRLVAITRLMSLTFIIKGLSTLQNALYKKSLNFKTPFKISIISGSISGIFGILLALQEFGVYSLIYAQISGWVISTALIWYYSNWRPSFEMDLLSIKNLWNFGSKYTAARFIDAVFLRMDTLVIGKVFSASILGIFYKAQSLNKLVVQYAFNSFSNVLFPSFSRLTEDKKRLKYSAVRVLHIVCFTTFFFAGLLYINAESLIVLLYTDKWLESVPLFKIMALYTFTVTLPPILNAPILALGHSGEVLRLEVKKKILYVFAIPVGIRFGLEAYLWSTMIVGLIGILILLPVAKRVYGLGLLEYWRIFAVYSFVFTALLFVDSFCITRNENLLLLLLFKSIVYSASYILTLGIFFRSRGFVELIELVKEKLSK